MNNNLRSVIILVSVAVGILIGQIDFISSNSAFLIEPFLMIMLFGVFLQVDLTGLKNSFKNVRFASLTVLINFIWTPLFAWFLASLFLTGEPDLQIGFLMLMVTPCTDWYLLFTDMAKGNVSLGAAQLPLNLILQIVLLPVYLLIFAGSVVDIEVLTLLKSILTVLLIPFALANIFRYIYLKKYGEKSLEEKILVHNDNIQFIFLNLAIVAMFASQGRLLLQNPELLLIMLIPVILFFAVNFIGVQLLGRTLKMSYEDTTALNLTTLARNSPLSLAIAVSVFPDHPMISLVLVIGPLIELPILTIIARVLLWIRPRYKVFGKKEEAG
ncbi:bile acid:sodium symporter [Methanimicrococcus sp. OttesenSCG-928-J09]|nr:bile acid:sodium symporter [Methanimicrococcus sp. OttesenSCG-928-J09]